MKNLRVILHCLFLIDSIEKITISIYQLMAAEEPP